MSAKTPTLEQASLNEVGKHCGGGGRWLSPFKTSRGTAGASKARRYRSCVWTMLRKVRSLPEARQGIIVITSTLSFAAWRSGLGKCWLLVTYDLDNTFRHVSA